MKSGRNITVSAPAKINLLGEHANVYGKPTILTAIDLRATVTISQGRTIQKDFVFLQKIIEKIIKKELKLKKIPLYSLNLSSKIPMGCGLGSSASLSAAYIGALLSYLRVKWDVNLINRLTFEAEKVFHGNPSGSDNSSVVFGGLIWFRKESPDLKLIHPLSFSIPSKLSRSFVLINTGKPSESTKDMVALVKNLYDKNPKLVDKVLEEQEKLVKELIPVLKKVNQKEFIRIIRKGEKNLESIGVVGKKAKKIIRKIESLGGTAKISGAGGVIADSGIILCFHKSKKVVINIAKVYNLPYFSVKLGVEGVRIEK
ncbi:mevalonate kinase [Candidatus Daviesbacteria bacterium RIFCSPHIGHO2_02_FULL_36_13]|uniref:mevalonate kinase n=1 Tax=Candidatus Daviesbacteria bacterium RIFCSPHIGHO2_02_FULL_36_13 TaxID=1797768 RepID=A0A1F5JV30_9BACT|nr:MAG: mevalonate kinase [Candidatus Daviesbacteria bacterium RIFCSPHIGHO2_02_FULL_36_13]